MTPTTLQHGGTNCPASNKRSLSTTRKKKAAILVAARQGTGTAAGSAGATFGLGPRDIRKELNVRVFYIGGACASWIIIARGRRFLFDGHIYLHQALAEISRAQGRP